MDSTEKGDGSVPQQGQVPAVENHDQSSSESSSASNDYNYDLSNDVKSTSDANTGGSTDNIPTESSPDTNSYVASDVKAAESADGATHPALEPSITSLLDLIQKTLNELRKKLLGGSTRKRHARDLGY